MIIHRIQKLAAKLENVSRERLEDNNPLGEWHANLYVIDRRQRVMFCHDKTRFVLFVPGLMKKDFANLDFWFKDLFANTMLKLGYEPELLEKALAQVDALRFDTVCDRSVQVSMRTAKLQDLDGMLMDVQKCDGTADVFSVGAIKRAPSDYQGDEDERMVAAC